MAELLCVRWDERRRIVKSTRNIYLYDACLLLNAINTFCASSSLVFLVPSSALSSAISELSAINRLTSSSPPFMNAARRADERAEGSGRMTRKSMTRGTRSMRRLYATCGRRKGSVRVGGNERKGGEVESYGKVTRIESEG